MASSLTSCHKLFTIILTNHNILMLCTSFQGAFGYDFSYNIDDIEEALAIVSEKLLAHGITSFCPTVITSPSSVYQRVSQIPTPYDFPKVFMKIRQ